MAQMELELEAEHRRIPGFGGTKIVSHYTADALGVVRSHWHSGKVVVLRQVMECDRYSQVCLYSATGRHNWRVHRIVALGWMGQCPEGMEVSHINGNHLDNRPENLQYETHAQNMARTEEHGTMPIGEANGFARLTEAQALEIYALAWAGDIGQIEIAERFCMARSLVSAIKQGRAWAETTGHKRVHRNPPTRAQLDRQNELGRARYKAKRAARRQTSGGVRS